MTHVLPKPTYPVTPAKSLRASMCSERVPQAWLFRAPAGSSEKHQAHPALSHPYPCQTPFQESRVLALRVAIRLKPQQPPPGLSCIRCYVLSPCWVPSTVVRILCGLSHVIPHGPPGSGGGIIATSQTKKLGGAEACCCLPFQEQEVDKPELFVLP